MVVAEVRIELKEGVADPEGRNVQKALELLGFSDVTNVRSIKVFEISLDGPELDVKKRVEEMCKRLLANPVIEEYRFQLREVAG